MHVFHSIYGLNNSRITCEEENLKHGHNGQLGLGLSFSRANCDGCTHLEIQKLLCIVRK